MVDVSYSFRGKILMHAPPVFSIMISADDRRNIRVSRRYVVSIYNVESFDHLLLVFWGAAIVFFLAKFINLHNADTQGFWVELSSQIENGWSSLIMSPRLRLTVGFAQVYSLPPVWAFSLHASWTLIVVTHSNPFMRRFLIFITRHN